MTDSSVSGSGDARGGTSLRQETDDGLDLTLDQPTEGTLVVAVTGELDMLTAPDLRQAVVDRMSSSSTIVLALDGVVFLGTSGLAVLIELREHAQRAGTTLRLACTERRVLRPLSIAGLHHLFEIRDSVQAALEE
ncbi:STAS domain-containing protein [Pseudonocardia endophytica]|uniref:Anti-sigma factor antagonist n=1 Tax=Pseudonocardia endophytica TaxID=401976 RepID=A0A4R1HUZ8_PSEEN|nr:STAS domain-containing protein [Pseudonocardia endophytica]TCK26088.1 anti-anti-sigma factor [Pseudonocardia endophytica]